MKELKFKLGRIVICPPDPPAAKRLLTDMGGGPWLQDKQTDVGFVYPDTEKGIFEVVDITSVSHTEGNLAAEPFLVELLEFTDGPNWMDLRGNAEPRGVACLEMDCDSWAELEAWRRFFKRRKIGVAQETLSREHSTLPDSVNSIVFDTRGILGVDLKFSFDCPL